MSPEDRRESDGRPEEDGDREVRLATFSSRVEAETAQGFLDDAGVDSALIVDDAGSVIPGVEIGFGPARLMVRASERDRAREVLRDAGLLEEAEGEGEGKG